MDLLPTEILQEIWSYLTFNELKEVSLVCRRWRDAADTLIVRRGIFCITYRRWCSLDGEANVLNVRRDYRTLAICSINGWEQLEEVGSAVPEILSSAKELLLDNILPDRLEWFYGEYRDWLGQLESLQVSLDVGEEEDDEVYLSRSAEDHSVLLVLPSLKHLVWRECVRRNENTIVTIEAPNLETVYLHAMNFCSEVLIHQSGQLKHMKFSLDTKEAVAVSFQAIFPGTVANLATLQLSDPYACDDMSFLKDLHQLRYLSMDFLCKKNVLPIIGDLHNCSQLKSLKISFSETKDFRGHHEDTLDLRSLLHDHPTIEILDLRRVNLATTDCIFSKNLKELHLMDVVYHGDTLSLTVINLQKLFLSMAILEKLDLTNSAKLNRLHVHLGEAKLERCFGKSIFPILVSHRSVQKLTLVRSAINRYATSTTPTNYLFDSGINIRAVSHVQHLELFWMDMSIDFFRNIAEWKSIESLTLNNCLIKCAGLNVNKQLRLPKTIRHMELEQVDLGGLHRDTFPLVIEGTTIVHKPQRKRWTLCAFDEEAGLFPDDWPVPDPWRKYWDC